MLSLSSSFRRVCVGCGFVLRRLGRPALVGAALLVLPTTGRPAPAAPPELQGRLRSEWIPEVPATTIGQLRALPPDALPQTLVRLVAWPRAQRARTLISVDDGTGTILVRTAQDNRLDVGYRYHFAGRPRYLFGQLMLDDAEFYAIRGLQLDLPVEAFQPCPDLRTAQMRCLQHPGENPPVVVRGIVTYLDLEGGSLRLQDATAGIWVPLSKSQIKVELGDELEIRAFVSPGDYAPVLTQPHLTLVGHPGRPEPKPLRAIALQTGLEDGLLVMVEGQVQEVRETPDHTELTLVNLGQSLLVEFPRHAAVALPERLIGARTRLVGVGTAYYNAFQQFAGFKLLVAQAADVTMLVPGPADRFSSPVQTVEGLVAFNPDTSLSGLKHVEGTVTLVAPNERIFLKDATGTIEVRTADTQGVQPGDRVGATGFLRFNTFGQTLTDGHVRGLGPGDALDPFPVGASDSKMAFFHGELVVLEATLVDRQESMQHRILLFQSEGRLFEAVVPNAIDITAWHNLEPGTQVALTGVAEVESDTGSDVVFRLWLRSAEDLQVLARPPWWTLNRALIALGLILLVSIGALLWVGLLRRRVLAQTKFIRKRLEIEAALARDYRNLFEQTNDFIFRCTIRGRILAVNPAAAKCLGYTPREMARLTVFQVVSRRDYRELQRFYRAHRKGIPFSTADVHLVSKDGRERVFEFTADVVQDARGRPLIHGIGRDLTDRREAEALLRIQSEKLQQAQKMEAIGNLAGGIAHDFNNILTGILGYLELAVLDLPEDSPARDDLDNVRKAGNRAKELVRQILTYSRRVEDLRRPIRLTDVVTEACQLLRASIPTTIDFRIAINPCCPPVLADATQIHQILMNLATNAYHAMRAEGGRLTISLEARQLTAPTEVGGTLLAPGEYAELTVADTGPGIPPEVLTRVFEPYFTTKPVGEGSGMGLAVVLGIIQSHHGAIALASTVGRGTRVQILLPQCATEPVGELPHQTLARGSRGRILLVDDEPMVAGVGQRMLQHLGYEVAIAFSGQAALEQLQGDPAAFDLVITDQTMPQLTGLGLLQEIKSLRADLPVLLCTGYSETLSPAVARDHGAAAMLSKPFDLAELGLTVRRIFAQG